MGERYHGSYEAISIHSLESVSSNHISDDTSKCDIQITQDMVQTLRCPEEPESSSQSYAPMHGAPTPPVSEAGDIDFYVSHETLNYNNEIDENAQSKHQLMIVYDRGDINCAMHFLIKSLVNPFVCNSVSKVLVQDCIREEFLQRVKEHMKPMHPDVTGSTRFLDNLEKLKEMNLETITTEVEFPDVSPVLVCSDRRSSKVGEDTVGVIFLSTFRTTLDIVDICAKDARQYCTVSVWNESIEELYQLVVCLNSTTFFFNCSHVTLHPITPSLVANKNEAFVHEDFHYESLRVHDQMKAIVFPIAAHLAQKCTDFKLVVPPISYLNE